MKKISTVQAFGQGFSGHWMVFYLAALAIHLPPATHYHWTGLREQPCQHPLPCLFFAQYLHRFDAGGADCGDERSNHRDD
jgi:hypothetical protein